MTPADADALYQLGASTGLLTSTAAVLGQLGDAEAARSGVRELLALQPGFARTARAQFAKWYLPDMVEHLIDGLRKAGLEVDG